MNFPVILPPMTDCVCVIAPNNEVITYGQSNGRYEFASVTKLISTHVIAGLVADGFVKFEDEIQDPYFNLGAVTLADLLSHSSGARSGNLDCVRPHSKRIYTTEAFDFAEKHIIKKLGSGFEGESIASIFNDGLNVDLGSTISISGSCGSGASGSFEDLVLLLHEIRNPKFVDPEIFKKVISPYHPNLSGIVPGWGHYENNLWGIGYEIKGDKTPHWMGPLASAQSYGHFGLSGAFAMHDPVNDISIASVSNENFGPWAKQAWPSLCEQIYSQHL